MGENPDPHPRQLFSGRFFVYNTESSHIEPYFAADTLYKIQLLTNEKPAPEMEPGLTSLTLKNLPLSY